MTTLLFSRACRYCLPRLPTSRSSAGRPRAPRGVGAGAAIFGQGIAQRILAYFAPGTRPPTPLPELTDREREVLDLLAKGHGNMAIAQRLFLSEKTVRNHVSNVFTKLHVADRAE